MCYPLVKPHVWKTMHSICRHLCTPCTLVWYTAYYQSSSVSSLYLSMVYCLLSVIICVLLVPWYGILLTISLHLCTPCTLVWYTAYCQSSSVSSLYLSTVYCLLSVLGTLTNWTIQLLSWLFTILRLKVSTKQTFGMPRFHFRCPPRKRDVQHSIRVPLHRGRKLEINQSTRYTLSFIKTHDNFR